MACPVVLGLLLVCVASVCGSEQVTDDSVALLWLQTFEQVGDMPKKDETVNPDPFLFLHRMSMYRLVIAATDPFMGSMGPGTAESPLYGLPVQLTWMRNSDRLSDPSGDTNCGVQSEEPQCISPKSWWSCENYFTSVLPFLSAAKQGLFGEGIEVEMQRPAGAEEYCTSYTDCSAKYSDTMTKWDAFFQGLKATEGSSQPDNEKKDHLLGLFWDAQMASTNDSSACNEKMGSYSSEEVSFMKSWLNSANYVSAARFQSNFQNSVLFISPLPSRILKAGEAPPIADLTDEENHTLKTFAWIGTMNSFTGGTLVNMWKSAMCSVTTREEGRSMLRGLLLDPGFPTGSLLAILTKMTTSC